MQANNWANGKKWTVSIWIAVLCLMFTVSNAQQKITLVSDKVIKDRVEFGIGKLQSAFTNKGYQVIRSNTALLGSGVNIVVGEHTSKSVKSALIKNKLPLPTSTAKEGYTIQSAKNLLIISGNDASGALYGCIHLLDELKINPTLPQNIHITSQPEMVLRGGAIGMNKPYRLPGRKVYEYPYTPEVFPWFYDKSLWIKYLDQLVENRMNSVYIWNGHPFASLVKLKDYPFAVEVDEATFKKNEEIFSFITKEADRRGIYIIQMFYNVLLSKPFAEHYGLETQERSRPLSPLIKDYMRKSVSAFVEKYPNVGLLVCLGEAMDTYQDDIDLFVESILPGVKDGLKASGRTDEPPVLLRDHDTDGPAVMEAGLKIYRNLYTMRKYNGESLTTYQPGGKWAEIHRTLSASGSVHIENVHVLANLEPFRWGSPEFVQKTVKAMHEIHGANGLHLFPQANYWDWPYSADKLPNGERLLEIDRDWIWYATWARYAWKCERPRSEEIKYWSSILAKKYGTDLSSGENIMNSYDQMGEISPKLLRKFGITEGNRQTMLLGMFMSQLVNPAKWTVYADFHASAGPPGEMLQEYIRKEYTGQAHQGELPPQLIAEAVEHGRKAVEEIEKAAKNVQAEKAEFQRLRNDAYCYDAFARHFSDKVKAAMLVLRYSYTKDIRQLDSAAMLLESSLVHYKELVSLTEETYLHANSMQTGQRRIPASGGDEKNKTWKELLPQYENELAVFRKNIQALRQKNAQGVSDTPAILASAKVTIKSSNYTFVPLEDSALLFSDKPNKLGKYAPELGALKAVRVNGGVQTSEGTVLQFTTDKPVQVLVGYFSTTRPGYAKAPVLETDATANDFGQAEIKIRNVADIVGLPPVNIHSYTFSAGENTLRIGKGLALIFGFAPASPPIVPHDAGIRPESIAGKENVDWLFY